MSELHWTGAAILLSLAVLGDGGMPLRRANDLHWIDVAGEDDLDARAREAPDGRPRPAALRVRGGWPDGAPRRRAS